MDADTAIDQAVWEDATVREVAAAVERVLGPDAQREISAFMFDASVSLLHPEGSPPDEGVEYAIVRTLRGGRDFDPSLPSDWHVSGRSPSRPAPLPRRGLDAETTISFDRSFPASAGYSEPAA